MIIKVLLMMISSAVVSLFSLIKTLVPNMNLLFSDFFQIITQIMGISIQALNFVHFIVGDSLVVILVMIPPILIAKYLVLPVIDICRRLIPFVNL